MDDSGRNDRVWTFRLLGLADARVDLVIGVAVILVLAASRFLLLANGPWEQDEAIFARSILHFEPKLHFPHPPFFPGWLAAGLLLTPLVGEPLRALQVASSLASIACLFPLAFLGRRMARPVVALACAAAVQFLPGAWVFAVRGFSSTAASFLALLAAAWLFRRLDSKRFFGFSALLAVSFLVRPVLVPVLAVLWIAGAARVQGWPRRLAGLGLAGAVGVAGFIPFLLAAGGLKEFAALTLSHGHEHFDQIDRFSMRIGDLGMVAAFGGEAAFIVAAVIAAVGLVAIGRRLGWKSAAVAGAVLAVLVATLLFAHVPTFPRYSVPLVLAMAPVAAAALSWLPTAAGAGLAVLALLIAAVQWFPLLVEQHATRFPMWEAAVTACDEARRTPGPTQVLAGRGGWAFVSYRDTLLRRSDATSAVPEPGHWSLRWAGATAAPHWLVVTSTYADVLPWERTQEVAGFSGVSSKAEKMSQHRFLTAAVVADLPLLRGTWWPPERDGSGRTFAWCSNGSRLVLPAVAEKEFLIVTTRAARGEKPLIVNVNRKMGYTVPGSGEVDTRKIPAETLFTDRENVIYLERQETYPPSERDRRPLAAAVYTVGCGRDDRVEVSAGDADALTAHGVALSGFHGKETFRDGVIGRWSLPTATIDMPAVAGPIELVLLAPRPPEARVEIRLADRMIGGPWVVPTVPRTYEVVVTPELAVRGRLHLELRVTPYATPALPNRPSRTLGVVLSSLTFAPAPAQSADDSVETPR